MDYHSLRGLVHHALSLAGEAGEVANEIKKVDRGSQSLSDAQVRMKIAMEIDDVFVYLLNIAGVLGIDLGRIHERVRAQNDARFTEQRRQREAAKRNGHG
jgi:NTP pyrophosphatase (non-canonical NTP hydrolase)